MGGSSKTPTVQTVAATPTPAPPVEEAKMTPFTDPTKDAQKAKAVSQGAASLQIPLGTIGSTGTVGTV